MSNDLCVQNREGHAALPDWVNLDKVPDCPRFVTTVIAPGPYNYWPFIIIGGFAAFVAFCVLVAFIVEKRTERKVQINQAMLNAGMPDVLRRLGNLETYTGKTLT